MVASLPSMLRMSEWELIYSMNHDGCSMFTFFENCSKYKTTFVVAKDSNGWVFGGLCTETWRVSSSFYGTGENFLFTFKKSNEITPFSWTGNDD